MNNKQIVYFVMDASGSMRPIRSRVVQELNRQLQTVKTEAKKHNIDTRVLARTFSTTILRPFLNDDSETVREVVASDYVIEDMTALLDAVHRTISDIQQMPLYDKGASVLVVVLTDGLENASVFTSKKFLTDLMRQMNMTDRWTFAFVCPPESVKDIKELGVPEGNIQPWDGSQKQLDSIGDNFVRSTGSYYAARATGQTAVTSFFKVDLQNVDKKVLRAKLENLRSTYKAVPVTKEAAIADYVEEKTKRPYAKGDVYYQLTKKERVQPSKSLILEDRTTKELLGGPETRAVIGMPTSGDCRVEPGNIADFNVYVQSRSTNRKLVRGTKILVKK